MTKNLFLTVFLFFLVPFFTVKANVNDFEYWDLLAKENRFKSDSLFHLYTLRALNLCPKNSVDFIELNLQAANSSLEAALLDSSIYYLKNAYELIDKKKHTRLLGMYYFSLASINSYEGNLSKSEANVDRSIKLLTEDNIEELSQAYNIKAALLFKRAKSEESLEVLLKVLALHKRQEPSGQLGRTLNNIGNAYLGIGEYQTAQIYYNRSAQIHSSLGNFSDMLKAINNLGLCYLNEGKFDSASFHFLRVINDDEFNYKNSLLKSKSLLNLGIVYLNQDNLAQALAVFQKSEVICRINKDKSGIILALINIGEVYTTLGKYKQAENYLLNALEEAKGFGQSRHLEAIYTRLVAVNYDRKDYKQAFDYQNSYIALKDSIYNEVEAKSLENLEEKYQQERKVFQDSLDFVLKSNALMLSQEKRAQELKSEQNIRNLLSICLLFSAGMFFLIYTKYRAQKKSNAIIDSTNEELKKTLISKEEKELLLKEIHHRVKNNLQIISSLMRLQSNTTSEYRLKSNYQEMQDRINSMAMVHEQLYGSKDFSTIRVIDYTNMLVDSVQRGYSGDGVQVIKRIEIKELTIETLIPLGLLINELLTNCFKYAVFDAKGIVEIELSSISEGKYLLIKDNGPGVEDIEDVFNKGTFGAELFKTLVEQLDGTYKISSENGFKVEVFF